jgi:hypothetical protein
MVRDPSLSFIGLEYFANQGDDLWNRSDAELLELGTSEAGTIGLFEPEEVLDGLVVRMPKAYPVYDGEYEAHLQTLRDWLDRFDNLYTVGRNGQHRYNNQDHSMLAGLYAARNLCGAKLDLWTINEDQSFHEEVRRDEAEGSEAQDVESGQRRSGLSDRLVPARAEGGIEELLQSAFAGYDEVALGGAVGIVASVSLAVATGILLLGSDQAFVPMLSLLGNYLFGFEVSWPGLAVGMVEAGGFGFGLGWITAKLINWLIAVSERDLERRLATLTTLEALDGGGVEQK